MIPFDLLRTAAGIAVLVAAATLVLRLHGVRVGWRMATGILRAIMQLAVLSVLAALLLAQSVTSTIVSAIVGRSLVLPAPVETPVAA